MESNRELCFKLVSDAQAVDQNISLPSLWDDSGCPWLPRGVDLFVLDSAAACGLEPTVRWLHMALRVPPGVQIPIVEGALLRVSAREIIMDMESYRKRALRSTPGWVDNHAKWTNRVLRMKKRACKMATEVAESAQAV